MATGVGALQHLVGAYILFIKNYVICIYHKYAGLLLKVAYIYLLKHAVKSTRKN